MVKFRDEKFKLLLVQLGFHNRGDVVVLAHTKRVDFGDYVVIKLSMNFVGDFNLLCCSHLSIGFALAVVGLGESLGGNVLIAGKYCLLRRLLAEFLTG